MSDEAHRVQVFLETSFYTGTRHWSWRCRTCGAVGGGFGSANQAQDSADIHEATE